MAIALAATKLHVDVYVPMAEGGRCDLILGIGNGLMRVQCKWASLVNDTVIVRCSTFRRTRSGDRVTTYTAAEVDAIAAYRHELDRCFLIPIDRAQATESSRCESLLRRTTSSAVSTGQTTSTSRLQFAAKGP